MRQTMAINLLSPIPTPNLIIIIGLRGMETGNYFDLRAICGKTVDSFVITGDLSKVESFTEQEVSSDLKDSCTHNLKDTCQNDSNSDNSLEEDLINLPSNNLDNLFKCFKCWGRSCYLHTNNDICPECRGTGLIPSSHSMATILEKLLLLKLPMLRESENEKTFSDQNSLNSLSFDNMNTLEEEQGFSRKKECCHPLRKISEQMEETQIFNNQLTSFGNSLANNEMEPPTRMEQCNFSQVSSVNYYGSQISYPPARCQNLFPSFTNETHSSQYKVYPEGRNRNPEQKIKNAELECSFEVPPHQKYKTRNSQNGYSSVKDLDLRTGQKYVFYNYQCDMCGISPIVNKRIHCQQCSDYDLCEKCYLMKAESHEHNHFTVIDGYSLLAKKKALFQKQSQTMVFITSHSSIK